MLEDVSRQSIKNSERLAKLEVGGEKAKKRQKAEPISSNSKKVFINKKNVHPGEFSFFIHFS